MRWLGLVALLGAGCDDTVFPSNARDYPATWLGVEVFMFDHCASCHPSIEPDADLPIDVEVDVCNNRGEYVVPGDPDASMLWRIISGERLDNDPAVMPFGTGPLPAKQVAFLREWIAAGAIIENCP